MSLTPALQALKMKISKVDASSRTSGQKSLLEELIVLERTLSDKMIESIANESFKETRLTSPGDGRCSCCGR